MPSLKFYLLGCLLAAALPFIAGSEKRPSSTPDAFPGWPATFEGRALKPAILSERDRRFAEGFPGRIAAFDDGRHLVIMRWIAAPTRKLHPAVHCFRGNGYAVKHQPLWRDSHGRPWSCFTAGKDGVTFRVYEQIHDGQGRTWPDASAWYWAALSRSSGPWWSLTLIECE